MHTDWFLPSAWRDLEWEGRVIDMNPEDFLKCASKVISDANGEGKLDKIRDMIHSSQKFDSLPFLEVSSTSTTMYPLLEGQAKVLKHDGRHRVAALIEQNVSVVPVIIVSMDDKSEKYITELITEDDKYLVKV
jgi:hypothetical protein